MPPSSPPPISTMVDLYSEGINVYVQEEEREGKADRYHAGP